MTEHEILAKGRDAYLRSAEESVRKIAEKVISAVMAAERRAIDARIEAAKTHDEIAADIRNEHDAENAALKEDLRLSVASLSSEKELEAYQKFVEKHEPCRLQRKIDGGKMPYVIQYGTGIGVCTTVVCQVCGEKQDITDDSVW